MQDTPDLNDHVSAIYSKREGTKGLVARKSGGTRNEAIRSSERALSPP